MILYIKSVWISILLTVRGKQMKEKVTVTFAGNELTVVSEDGEEYVQNLAKVLDRRISEMVMVKNRCTKTEALMLCALDYLDATVKLKAEVRDLKEQLQQRNNGKY